MAKNSPRTVPYRRAREQKTNYKKRLALLLSGRPRVVVRVTNQRIIAQLVQFAVQGDKIIAAADSFSLRKLGWTNSTLNLPAAYLTGLLLGKKGLAQVCTEAVADTGFRHPTKKGRMYAFLKGVIDVGITIPHDPAIFPPEDRLQGKHLKSSIMAEFEAVHHKIMNNKIESA